MVHIRLIGTFIIVLVIISVASGYVSTSNSYYTEGGGVVEEVSLSNMAYANQVSIYQDSLFADADAVLADDSKSGSFENHILTTGAGSAFGANIRAESDKQFTYHRGFATGAHADDKTALSYTLQSGQTDANYFTDGGSVKESIAVENTQYVNSAKVVPHALSGVGNADLVDGIGMIADRIIVDTNEGDFGTGFFAIAGNQLNLGKSFVAGDRTDAQTTMSYAFGSGLADVGYFNPDTGVNEAILTEASMYKGQVQNTVDELQSQGYGRATEDAPGGFMHDIQMVYDGKPCEINAALNTSVGTYGSEAYMPVVYTWSTLVDSDGNHAENAISTKAYNGNRDTNMQITGKAIGMTDKCAGPLHLSPIGFIGISKELYMSYEITR